jgi:hypothetical protein
LQGVYVTALLDTFGLSIYADQRNSTVSIDVKQRLKVAIALIGNPPSGWCECSCHVNLWSLFGCSLGGASALVTFIYVLFLVAP